MLETNKHGNGVENGFAEHEACKSILSQTCLNIISCLHTVLFWVRDWLCHFLVVCLISFLNLHNYSDYY